jgi:hypothetical protein
MRGRRQASVLVAVVLLVGASRAEAARADVPTGFYGVNPGDLFLLPQTKWDDQVAAIRGGGVDAVRLLAPWSDLEPRAPDADGRRYLSWQLIDSQVEALARHGLRWEPLICFTATWDETVPGDYTSAPIDSEHLAGFAALLARRYGPGGAFWAAHPDLVPVPVRAYELWNEPNAAAYWHPQADAPERYADLYAAVREAIRRVDGAARVAVGGLASPGTGVIPAAAFVGRMLEHRPDLRGRIDAVGYHPYSPRLSLVYGQLAAFRRALDRLAGPGVPIDVNEVGWTTAETPEAQRAADLAALTEALPRSDCGVGRLMPYAWIGPEQDPADRLQWFGISNRDGTLKPSGAAYLRATRRTAGATDSGPPRALCEPRLRLRLNAVTPAPGGRPRLEVASSCAAACALSLRVTPHGRGRTLARRVLRFRRGARTVHLMLPRSARPGVRLALRARAWTSTGWRATRVRTVHMPRR